MNQEGENLCESLMLEIEKTSKALIYLRTPFLNFSTFTFTLQSELFASLFHREF
jgi:hypothetical protein